MLKRKTGWLCEETQRRKKLMKRYSQMKMECKFIIEIKWTKMILLMLSISQKIIWISSKEMMILDIWI